MKKWFASVLIFTLALSLAACGSASSSPAATAGGTASASVAAADVSTQETYTIGFDVTNLTNETFVQMSQVFQSFCDERGWKLITASNNEDSATQVSNLEGMITAGCNAVFSQNSNPTATESVYQQIKDAGIVLVAYDAASDAADYCWYCDNYELGYAVGQMAGKWVTDNLDGKANAVFFEVPQLDFLVARSQGNIDGFKDAAPEAVVLATAPASASDSDVVMENLLQAYPDLNVVICLSDEDAYLAYQILNSEISRKGLDPSNYGMFANDGSDTVLPLIAGDTIYRGTISMGLQDIVPTAVCEAIEYALTGRGTEYPRDNFYATQAITIDNVAQYL
jgi:ribose transport system substrate-binding protein